MFQFSGFPSWSYGFTSGSQVLHLRGFPIRKSADRSLFAAPRGFSQLVTSFVGSWCQGIHLMLFLAWTSSFLGSYYSLAFFCLSLANNWLGYHLLFWKRPLLFSPWLFRVSAQLQFFYHDFLKDLFYLLFFWNLKIICSFLLFFFIRFSMNIFVSDTSFSFDSVPIQNRAFPQN